MLAMRRYKEDGKTMVEVTNVSNERITIVTHIYTCYDDSGRVTDTARFSELASIYRGQWWTFEEEPGTKHQVQGQGGARA